MNKDTQIETIVSDVTKAAAFHSVIKSAKEMEKAVDILSQLNKINDKITAEKEKVTKPLNEALRTERARWKPAETILETAIAAIRKGITAFQTEQKKLADEEAEKIANRVGPGKGKFTPETAVAKLDAIDRPAESVETASGKVKFREVKKFEVMDITMLPVEYILPNETAIRKAMNSGINIPGVRYYEEQQVINLR